MLNLNQLQFLYPLLFGSTFVWIVTAPGCDTAPVLREDSTISSEKDHTSAEEYFFGLKVEPTLDELGRQVPFRGVDENGFPLTPDDYALVPIWKQVIPNWKKDFFKNWPHDPLRWEKHINNFVLMDKVLIKLWNQGDHDFIAATITSEGRVYPQYPNTIYVQWKEKIDKNGVKKRYIGRAGSSGDVKLTDEQMRTGQIPAGIRVLDHDSGGYDAYDFLTEVELNAGCGSEVSGVSIRCANSANQVDE